MELNITKIILKTLKHFTLKGIKNALILWLAQQYNTVLKTSEQCFLKCHNNVFVYAIMNISQKCYVILYKIYIYFTQIQILSSLEGQALLDPAGPLCGH